MVIPWHFDGGLECTDLHYVRLGDIMAEPQKTSTGERVIVPGWRPGDERADVPSMIRVDQAGEYGATRIYAGQLAVLGDRHPMSRTIARMAAQEQRHLEEFDRLIADRGVRPTLLQPVWNVAGYALGAATALMGPEAAMACTAAVETEIDKHYSEQLKALGDDDPDLSGTIAEFQAEELEHRDAAIAAGAENAPGYPVLSAFIRAGCRAAIALSKRI
jgi:ubiquinone biosynthesis monooxygenase Coq7